MTHPITNSKHKIVGDVIVPADYQGHLTSRSSDRNRQMCKCLLNADKSCSTDGSVIWDNHTLHGSSVPHTSPQMMWEAFCLCGNTGQGAGRQGEKCNKEGMTERNCYGLMVTPTSYSPMPLGVGGQGEYWRWEWKSEVEHGKKEVGESCFSFFSLFIPILLYF